MDLPSFATVPFSRRLLGAGIVVGEPDLDCRQEEAVGMCA